MTYVIASSQARRSASSPQALPPFRRAQTYYDGAQYEESRGQASPQVCRASVRDLQDEKDEYPCEKDPGEQTLHGSTPFASDTNLISPWPLRTMSSRGIGHVSAGAYGLSGSRRPRPLPSTEVVLPDLQNSPLVGTRIC